MMDFKKSFFYGLENVKWYYLILLLILAIVYAITDAYELSTVSFISLILIFIIGFGGIIGTKISGKLKTFKHSWLKILKNMGIYTAVNLIFIIAQFALAIIGVYLIYSLAPKNITSIEELIYSMPSGLLLSIILIFIIFSLGVLILEIIKTMGLVRYFKTNKFKDNFRIAKHFKAIFTKEYFTIAFFVIGYALITIVIISLIYLLLIIFTDTITLIIVNILAATIMYIITSTHYSLLSDYLVDKK